MSKTRKLKVITNDTKEAKLIDAETGEMIDHVISIKIKIDASTDFKPVATIVLADINLDMELLDTELSYDSSKDSYAYPEMLRALSVEDALDTRDYSKYVISHARLHDQDIISMNSLPND